jgi:hypothetical protein
MKTPKKAVNKELEKNMRKAFNSLLNSQPEYSGHKNQDLADKMNRIVMSGEKK